MTDVITTPGVRLSDAAIRRRMIADFWFYFRQNRGAVGHVTRAMVVESPSLRMTML